MIPQLCIFHSAEQRRNPIWFSAAIAVELLASGRSFDSLLVPLGNGALLTGIARWIKAHSPATRVIGVCSAHASAMCDSWRSGRVVQHAEAPTIADGIAVRIPIPEAVEDMRGLVDDVVLVEDATIVRAMQLVFEHERMIVEPAGAAGIAALLEHPALREPRRIATILCGNNLTPQQIQTWPLPPRS